MTEKAPGTEAKEEHGPVGVALATSVRANATAFGFSITITISFGALQRLEGQPTLLEILLFGVAAAVAVGVLEGAVTRGFRQRVGTAPAEVAMLGTALNFVSVAAGVGAAIAVAEIAGGLTAWVVGGAAGVTVYMLTESVEVLLAEYVQRWRGDPEAEAEQT
jgi:hypothetical protein